MVNGPGKENMAGKRWVRNPIRGLIMALRPNLQPKSTFNNFGLSTDTGMSFVDSDRCRRVDFMHTS